MDTGPLEYGVIGLQDDQFASAILPELNAIQKKGAIRIVDLLFVRKSVDGMLKVSEVSELSTEKLQPYQGIVENLMGLLTLQDVETLTSAIPAGTSAVIVLLEHIWASELAESVRKAGGVLFAGGIVKADALKKVRAELAAKEANYA